MLEVLIGDDDPESAKLMYDVTSSSLRFLAYRMNLGQRFVPDVWELTALPGTQNRSDRQIGSYASWKYKLEFKEDPEKYGTATGETSRVV